MRWPFGALMVGALATSGCKGPMAKVEALRDALARGDASAVRRATEGFAACPETAPVALAAGQPSPHDKGCFAEIARQLGSKKGFNPSPADQAAAATVALVLVRDRRGDWVAHSDTWLGLVKTGKGPGPDALRLALARAMAEAAPAIGRSIDEEKDAISALQAIASAIPGACPTYQMIGSRLDPAKFPPELTADHSACVQRDLSRREGAGPSYGAGTFRALEGSLALWREAERALRLGAANSEAGAKTALDAKLTMIEAATQKNATKKLPATAPERTLTVLGDVHAEAGIRLWKDAGADAAATQR
jgi:hypothetical protein